MKLVPLEAAVQNYVRNRTAFYQTLLPRLPHPKSQELLTRAVQPVDTEFPTGRFSAMAELTPLLDNLRLRDLLKKPEFGRALGRTVISFEEALQRAQWVEETGVVLFEQLAHLVPAEQAVAQQRHARQNALSALLRLEDDLRYHRVRLTDSDSAA